MSSKRFVRHDQDGLSGREYFDASSKLWYELWNQRSFDKQAVKKIVVREVSIEARFSISDETQFYLDTTSGIIPKERMLPNLYFLLGLLNSRLLEYYYKRTTVPKAGGFYIYKHMFLRPLPIRRIDFSDPGEKAMHHRIVGLVEEMLELQRRVSPIRNTPCNERDELLRAIEQKDREIDQAVYDLYGLTEEERRIVEGAADRG